MQKKMHSQQKNNIYHVCLLTYCLMVCEKAEHNCEYVKLANILVIAIPYIRRIINAQRYMSKRLGFCSNCRYEFNFVY